MRWKRGQKAQLARNCNTVTNHICNILNSKSVASLSLAIVMEREAEKMGLDLTRLDVLYPTESTNPLIADKR